MSYLLFQRGTPNAFKSVRPSDRDPLGADYCRSFLRRTAKTSITTKTPVSRVLPPSENGYSAIANKWVLFCPSVKFVPFSDCGSRTLIARY